MGCRLLQGFDKVVPPFEALLTFHGGEGFEEVVPFSKTRRNSACLKGQLLGGIAVENGYSVGFRMV